MRRALPVVLLLIGSVAECLELHKVEVPHYKRVGEPAELFCQFQLGRDRLYAVKWYKDNEEFFRYVPRFNPSIHTHPVPGVHVDAHRSTSEVVHLKSVTVRSTGLYRCEVSAEAPSFSSSMGEDRMTVVYLPKEGPQITGIRDAHEYEVGDVLDLNCTSSRSFPPARISWYINDLPVADNSDKNPFYDNSMDFANPMGSSHLSRHSSASSTSHNSNINNNNNNGNNLIRATSSRLLLELTQSHFTKGAAKIRCVARIYPLFWQDGDEKKIDYKNPANVSTSSDKWEDNYASNNPNRHHNQHNKHNTEAGHDNEMANHQHHQLHEKLGSLYKGEALVQIRGASCKIHSSIKSLLALPLLILLSALAH